MSSSSPKTSKLAYTWGRHRHCQWTSPHTAATQTWPPTLHMSRTWPQHAWSKCNLQHTRGICNLYPWRYVKVSVPEVDVTVSLRNPSPRSYLQYLIVNTSEVGDLAPAYTKSMSYLFMKASKSVCKKQTTALSSEESRVAKKAAATQIWSSTLPKS